jgi:hypothetical protein
MKVSQRRDHSPVKVRNEIHIKIDNSRRGEEETASKKKEKDTEEKALKRLANLEYGNQAILSRTGQGYSRGSGGGVYTQGNIDLSDPNERKQTNIVSRNTPIGAAQDIHSYNDPNRSTTNFTPPSQTASVEFLDDESLTPEEMNMIKDLPPNEQLLAIEDIKKKRGRPKGSKNKKRVSMETQTEPETVTVETPLTSMFNNEDNVKVEATPFGVPDHLARTDKKTQRTNAYTEHLEEIRKLRMDQVPPRPDRNIEL